MDAAQKTFITIRNVRCAGFIAKRVLCSGEGFSRVDRTAAVGQRNYLSWS
jgi:hypothetical protein